MKKILYILIANSVLTLAVLAVGVITIKNANEMALGERTSLYRPYIDVATTSTARTSLTTGTSTPSIAGSVRAFIDTAATTFKGLVIRAVGSQAVNLLETQNSVGSQLFAIAANGAISASSTATSTFANGIVLSGGCIQLVDGTCATSASAGANTALSNLASVAINTTLLSDTDNTDDLGSQAIRWRNYYGSGNLAASTTLIIGTSGTANVTSTIYHGLSANTLTVGGSTSTFANGLQLNGGCYRNSAGNCLTAATYPNYYSNIYSSTTIGTGGVWTVPHSLGAVPSIIELYCQLAAQYIGAATATSTANESQKNWFNETAGNGGTASSGGVFAFDIGATASDFFGKITAINSDNFQVTWNFVGSSMGSQALNCLYTVR